MAADSIPPASPLGRLGDLASWSLDAAGAALSALAGLAPGSWRIAVTGLQRSGKTVFLTSFVHALLHARDSPVEAFPFFPWRARLRAVELRPIPGLAEFPYRERLAELLAEPPAWPQPTTGLSGLRVRLRLEPAAAWLDRLLEPQTIDLDLIDYPGEWLLDLPLLALPYADWSAQMAELADAGARRPLAARWHAELAGFDPAAREDGFALARLSSAYVEYLRAGRGAGLSYLQPGRFLTGAAPLEALFFPLPGGGGRRFAAGSNGAALEQRYEAYRGQVRRFYEQVFGRLRRQVVLVDLLTALQAGPDAFADLALATRTVVEAFEDLQPALARWLPVGGLDRLVLAATKADHVTAGQHNNLVGLLRDMLGEPLMRLDARQSGLLAVAAVRATTQVTRLWQGEPMQFLRGLPAGRDETVEVRPGEIPGTLPSRDSFAQHVFHIRPFEPPMLGSAAAQRPLPHINLDKVLQALIA